MKNGLKHIRQASVLVLFCGQPVLLCAQEIPANYSETSSLIFAIFKVLGSLAIVIALMLALIYLIKKIGINKNLGDTSLIRVLDNKMVAPKKYIAIVEIAGKTVSLGITEHNINLLTEIEPAALETVSANPRERSSQSLPLQFSSLLKKATGKQSLRVNHDDK